MDSYLKSVEVEGYKSIRKAAVDFQTGLNIIIGANGSGKTNFLDFLNFILNRGFVHFAGIKSYRYERFIVHFQSGDESNSLSSNLDNYTQNLRYQKGSDPAKEAKIDLKEIRDSSEKYHETLKKAGEIPKFPGVRLISFDTPSNVYFLDSIVTLEIEKLVNIRGSSDFKDYLGFIEELEVDLLFGSEIENCNPSDLSKAISDFFDSYISKKNLKIVASLKNYTQIKAFRLNPNFAIQKLKDGKYEAINLYFEFLVNNTWINWDSLSDGTKRLFYIITEILTGNSGIILIEEPELGIHPHQLHLLMQFLKEQSKSKQIILTTHSPQVLDILAPEELDRVIITEMTENGTKLSHLNDQQRKKALHYMKTDGFLSDYWLYSDLEKEVI